MNYNDIFYEEYLKRYKLAIKNGFYIEAICIIYAGLESELYKFLHTTGFIQFNNNKYVVTQKFRREYRIIFKLPEKKTFNIKNISTRRNYIISFLSFAENEMIIPVDNHNYKYFNDLRNVLNKKIEISVLKNNLKEMDKWCDMRNMIIHGLLNKNPQKIYDDMKKCATDGLKIYEELKNIVANFRKDNNLRNTYKIFDHN